MKSKILLHPNYFPSIASMATIAKTEEVVFEVEDHSQKQTYRNRTYIAHCNGKLLLNVPVKHSATGERQKTKSVWVENDFPWQAQHWKSLQSAYRTSPFFEYYEDDLEPLFKIPVTNLLDHNIQIFELLIDLLGLEVTISKTEVFQPNPGIADFRYLVDVKKENNNSFKPYSQVFEANHDFLPNLSVLDLLFNEGPNALIYLESHPTVVFRG